MVTKLRDHFPQVRVEHAKACAGLVGRNIIDSNDPLLSRNKRLLGGGGRSKSGNWKEIAIFLPKYDIKWLEMKCKTTTDEVFRMTLNYVTLMQMYKNMVVAVRSGDSIMIEYMYVKFLPIFEASGKRNYVEIVCTMIESLYATIKPKILHLV